MSELTSVNDLRFLGFQSLQASYALQFTKKRVIAMHRKSSFGSACSLSAIEDVERLATKDAFSIRSSHADSRFYWW